MRVVSGKYFLVKLLCLCVSDTSVKVIAFRSYHPLHTTVPRLEACSEVICESTSSNSSVFTCTWRDRFKISEVIFLNCTVNLYTFP